MNAPVRTNLQHAYEQNRQRIAHLWSEAQAIASGDAASRYLVRQGVHGAWPDTLRLHPALEYWHTDSQGRATCIGTFPALLAALEIDVHPHGLFQPAVRHTVALQRFYLTARGTPAPVPSFIKATGTDGHIKGAAVRLSAPRVQADGVVLGVAVGVVSALRFAAALRMPVWAVSDAAALAHLRAGPQGCAVWPVLPRADGHATHSPHHHRPQRLKESPWQRRRPTPQARARHRTTPAHKPQCKQLHKERHQLAHRRCSSPCSRPPSPSGLPRC